MMLRLNPTQVRNALSRLSVERPNLFGADGHKFQLNPPLTEAEVETFESHHKISFPSDYRHFISQVGNGGAGPYYGIFPLGQMDGVGHRLQPWPESGLLGNLDLPFPFCEAWNDLSEMPSDDLIEADYDEYARKLDVFEERYFDPSRMNGAIPICHKGCALRVWLVVSGEESGHLWEDGRADRTGIFPLVLKNGSRASFSTWYAEWLADPLEVVLP